ncbi:UNC-50 [Mycotypha africana]|uniref:UNC-50 n=1 Tax=Mycotypha africana TaxID=64632 RepID=UPI002301D407|nr:UNC-50 [Mycotypha africana]KAI8968901.1 UNC-50 [Mycotypha africana]
MTSILPTTSTANNRFNSSNPSFRYYASPQEPIRHGKKSTRILRRLFRFPHMDFEFALWQMCYLLISPKRVYRNIYLHKQTKNRWSRDDPAFIILTMIFLSRLLWGYTYGLNTYGTVRLILSMVFIDFLLVGCIISTLTWYITSNFLAETINAYAIAQKVEWTYAFDIHCNSFVPVYIILYIVQVFFLPLILKDNWVSMCIGNFMYCASLIWYLISTFLGFHALPFLVHTELFLYPVALCIALFVASLFGFNIPQCFLGFYFPS